MVEISPAQVTSALAALFGARYAIEQGFPINVRFLWKLEEEIGSPNFAAGLKNRTAIPRPDSVVVSDTIWLAKGKPAMPYGLRGLLGARLTLCTGTKDAHSGVTGGAARNPLAELMEVAHSCVDAKSGRVKIPGFYQDVVEPTKAEIRSFLASGFQVRSFKQAYGFQTLRMSDPAEIMRRIWASPTFEIHGLTGGYHGPGVKTVVPGHGELKISMRLVPNQTPEKAFALLKKNLATITWEAGHQIDEAALRSTLLDRSQPVDVLVIGGALRIRAAMNVTRTVPIVGIDLESDPVASGFAKSLARPGGNASGVWMDMPELVGKHLQLLREAVPRLDRVAVFWDDRFLGPQFAAVEAAARTSNIALSWVAVHKEAEFSGAMEQLLVRQPQALLVLSSPTVFASLPRVAELARDHRLPSICLFSNYADAGGLLSYGPDFSSMYRQLASYVHRIFKGAKVSDLPIERPTKFELAINLKTAKALELTVPRAVLTRADRVIE